MGGIDIATDPVQDPVIAGPNNTFYLVGGTDGSQSFSLSDIWRLDMAGTLSSNLPNDALGSWNQVSIDNLPPRADGAGAVLGQHVVAVGGCNYPSLNESCVLQDSYILDLEANSQKSPQGCPVPRMNPVLVANTNTFSTSFSSQLFLLLGTFNESLWSDNGNLEKGEVVSHSNFISSLPSSHTCGRLFLMSTQDYGAGSYPLVIQVSLLTHSRANC